jgi:hypothetical protein
MSTIATVGCGNLCEGTHTIKEEIRTLRSNGDLQIKYGTTEFVGAVETGVGLQDSFELRDTDKVVGLGASWMRGNQTIEFAASSNRLGERLYNLHKNLLTDFQGDELSIGESFEENVQVTIYHYEKWPETSRETFDGKVTVKVESLSKPVKINETASGFKTEPFITVSVSSEVQTSDGPLNVSGTEKIFLSYFTQDLEAKNCGFMSDPS